MILRDGGCAFPSCGVPASACDGHHIIHWRNHGPTKVDNLVLLCPHHHRLVHRSDWAIEMVDRTPRFIPPAYIDPHRRPRTNSARRSIPAAA
ncbi:HNH endonuclease signature motif containing protein [Actinocrispum sp. NPDC049592]|uniref:HNH endonuclease signature motif containing protein n=1 Tax=Actinocrispum sp. NPDC049592 TaxID=3154835 RepID=UPI00341A4527